jgi:hypothetical protein
MSALQWRRHLRFSEIVVGGFWFGGEDGAWPIGAGDDGAGGRREVGRLHATSIGSNNFVDNMQVRGLAARPPGVAYGGGDTLYPLLAPTCAAPNDMKQGDC